MKKIHLKISPPFIALIATLIIICCAYYLPTFILPEGWHLGIAITLIIVAGIIALLALIIMFQVGTTISPYSPAQSQQLITRGIFAYSRHPMYLSLAIGLFGLCFLLQTWFGLLGVAFYLWAVTEWQIKPEEAILQQQFGDYAAYCQRVRRWI